MQRLHYARSKSHGQRGGTGADRGSGGQQGLEPEAMVLLEGQGSAPAETAIVFQPIGSGLVEGRDIIPDPREMPVPGGLEDIPVELP